MPAKNLGKSQLSKPFKLVSPYKPAGDQDKVISDMINSLTKGNKEQTILGATGTGKTFIMASIVEKLQRPTLVIAHNKTLAAQLAGEFRKFFPENAVHYFVSYYDYYQPESYLPRSDTYIEKQTQINEEIERLRNASTQALLTRKDVLIVASVSCIYGLGNPEDFKALKIEMEVGKEYRLNKLLRRLIDLQYTRTNADLKRGYFRLRGDTLEVYPTSEDKIAYRFSFFGDELEKIESFDIVTGTEIENIEIYTVFPASQYVTTQEKITNTVGQIEKDMFDQIGSFEGEGKLLQAQRIKERTMNDIEMLQTVGFTSGIENYSIYFDGRMDGEPPTTLLDYFPDDSLAFIDESHITLPQLAAMYNGDRSRKQTLVDFGFRLPSALNNRPLRINESFGKFNQAIYVSATPGNFEQGLSTRISKHEMAHRLENKVDIKVSEAIIRPTGLLDPEIIIKPVKNQVDDVLEEVRKRIQTGERVLITTLTKKFAEELDIYFKQINIKSAYIHSDIDTLERVEVLADLRKGKYDVLIGINLLREGLDLPEVSLVAIFDADKEGFLRSRTSLIQIIGRAARHYKGQVIMYANNITKSMKAAIEETERRRELQTAHNKKHGITPKSTTRKIETIVNNLKKEVEENEGYGKAGAILTQNGFEKVKGKKKLSGEYKKPKESDSIHGGQRLSGSKKKRQAYAGFEDEKSLFMKELKDSGKTIQELETEMQTAIDSMDFEKAAAIRDILEGE